MMEKKHIILGIMLLSFCFLTSLGTTDAAKTSSYNFCTQFPEFPECAGWRTEPISDNYWFCEYVDLKNLCNNPPNPEKQISPRTSDYCCNLIGSEFELQKKDPIKLPDQAITPNNTTESILPLVIWTDKDHYNYRDKTKVFGKFDFTNPTIIENIGHPEFYQTGEITEDNFTIDIKLNGRTILRHIPVSPEGWFSTYFFHNNIYRYSTQNNLLEIEYIVSSDDIPLGGPKTHAIYQFTTGDIAKEDDSFEMWLDDSKMPNKIIYGVNVKNAERFIELSRYDLVITRLTTPEGYVIPVDSVFAIKDITAEYDGFKEYGYGTYELQITYGNNTSKKTFEYTDSGSAEILGS
jgi:hypothetical protein